MTNITCDAANLEIVSDLCLSGALNRSEECFPAQNTKRRALYLHFQLFVAIFFVCLFRVLVAGVLQGLSAAIGIGGNLLTVVAISYAKYRRR